MPYSWAHPIVEKRSLAARLLNRKALKTSGQSGKMEAIFTSALSEVQRMLQTRECNGSNSLNAPKKYCAFSCASRSESASYGALKQSQSHKELFRRICCPLLPETGEVVLAHLKAALASGCFEGVNNELQAAIHAAAQHRDPADSPPAPLSGCR